jgi:aconitate hydratase
VAVIAKSFARIHETNLKKQGILALTFSNPADYDLVTPKTTISLLDLKNLKPGKPVLAVLKTPNAPQVRLQLKHTLNPQQIEWFVDGSFLNTMRKKLSPRTRSK